MERLFRLTQEAIQRVPVNFVRYLDGDIDWEYRLIGISGARGCGKTIMMQQHLKQLNKEGTTLYASLDDIYFSENKLVYFAESFYRKGGEVLLLDEVHKYPAWSQELKNIYDTLPSLKVVFTSSSALELEKGTHDLSRRVLMYSMAGMSFREFMLLKYNINLPVYKLSEILSSHTKISNEISSRIRPLAYFDEYLREGYYPFFKDARHNYLRQLTTTINLTVETDLPAIHNIDFGSVLKIKKLLSVISRIVPYKPNVEDLARQTGTSRDTLLRYLYYLDRAQIITWLGSDMAGINYLNKPEKLYLNNPNLVHALGGEMSNYGNLRETFFLNQLSVRHKVTYPANGDFLVDNSLLFEIGGKKKGKKQIAGIENAYIAADDIEYGYENKIPLWIFGLMY